MMLERIQIPSTVTYIQKHAFIDCLRLEAIEFCTDIEEFLDLMLLRDWWKCGVSTRLIRTYSFLAQYNIPKRFGDLKRYGETKVLTWTAQIQDMLQRIPTMISLQDDDEDDEVVASEGNDVDAVSNNDKSEDL